MFKKLILAAALTLTATGVYADPAAGNIDEARVVSVAADGQTEVEGDWTDSKEVNTVEESSTARRMTQAEKAKNAQENDRFGGAITIVAMCIVLFALIVLSLLFLGFGKISSKVMSHKKLESHGLTKEDSDHPHEELDSGEVIAAIALALSQHLDTKGHDMEDTILTIRRMKRAYSPWNSKIYNLRELPELHRNVRR